jgi:hypothetical protein
VWLIDFNVAWCERVEYGVTGPLARTSTQRELDDATEDEDEEGGGNRHIQWVAHSSPHASVALPIS